MTIEAMVKIVEEFTPEETKMVRDAYREFLKNFDCQACPTAKIVNGQRESTDLLDFVMKKQEPSMFDPCRLCHGFSTLLPEEDYGCPCLVLGKDEAHKRLVELVDSWTK
jgi:hypothetical protein